MIRRVLNPQRHDSIPKVIFDNLRKLVTDYSVTNLRVGMHNVIILHNCHFIL